MQMKPFEFAFYREYLRNVCDQESKRGLQAALAKSAGCQASYFSQMLKDRVHLTEDQAIGVAEYLQLSHKEMEHFMLLLRWEKAGTEKLKNFLKKAIEESIKGQLNLSYQVGAARIVYSEEDLGKYFSSWIPSAVHLLTSSPNFNTAEQISKRLGVPKEKIFEALQLLLKMGFVQNRGDRWQFSKGSMHVEKESPWQSPMQASRRHLAMCSILENPPEAVHFSSLFTIDKDDFGELKKMTSRYIQKSHEKIKTSGTEELYCLCLDLFEVI